MSCISCACTALPCGCCGGVQALTPQPVANRPGLPALRYRAGTHGSFMQTMLARLSTITVDGPGADGQALTGLRPLQGLTTRDTSDPSIALLDAWATAADVLTFYQERIANEAYLRTATERRSVLELARLVNYTPRAGVSATTYLAYTLDDNQVDPTTIASGTRTQSVPAPGETAQTFETSEDLAARREWNNLQVRLHAPQDITVDNVLTVEALQVAGTVTNLRAGDKLLFVFANDGPQNAVRTVDGVDTRFADQTSSIRLRPLDPVLLQCVALLLAFMSKAALMLTGDTSGTVRSALTESEHILSDVRVGTVTEPDSWSGRLRKWTGDVGVPQPLTDAITQLAQQIRAVEPPSSAATNPTTTPAVFAGALLQPAIAQVRNSLQLSRNLAQAFLPQGLRAVEGQSGFNRVNTAGWRLAAVSADATSSPAPSPTPSPVLALKAPTYADVATQMLIGFAPTLKRSYYAAWAGAALNPAPATLQGVYAMRARASLFGAGAAKLPTYSAGGSLAGNVPAGTLLPPNQWNDWTYGDADDETNDNAFLDQAYENIAIGSFVVTELYGDRQVLRVTGATTLPRTAYGISGQTTQLAFATVGNRSWRNFEATDSIADLRSTKLYVQSEPLTLVPTPVTGPVGATDPADTTGARQIELDGLYDGLTSGRWVIVEGERDDIAAVAGVRVAELQMISGVSHSYDAALPGDTVHTTLVLATDLAYRYKRSTVTLYGNVAKATHGQTRFEVLGNGDGAQALQSFTLKQPPLTFVAAPTAAGAQSTLEVQVNGIDWHESGSLAWLGAKDRGFVTLTGDDGSTRLTFGDGVNGARLPSGVQNVKAIYRNGIGQAGNVKAGQLTLLQSRPLGVRAVVNPLAASGGADKETRDLARENAPLSVMALDRLVSICDYTDFTRCFAGIGKALAKRVSDGRQQLVYITIAGVDDIPIDSTSDLYRNLLEALRDAGDADLPLRVDLRELKALVLSANIKLLPDYVWEPVVSAVRAQLLDAFGFANRALGQPARVCEVLAAIQGVVGVDYVDIDAFGAVPQTGASSAPTRTAGAQAASGLITQDQLAAAIAAIVRPRRTRFGGGKEHLPPDVTAWPGGADPGLHAGLQAGLLRAAELAVFMPAVPDTLVLNQIP